MTKVQLALELLATVAEQALEDQSIEICMGGPLKQGRGKTAGAKEQQYLIVRRPDDQEENKATLYHITDLSTFADEHQALLDDNSALNGTSATFKLLDDNYKVAVLSCAQVVD